jgi:phospholipase/carboxylesterase
VLITHVSRDPIMYVAFALQSSEMLRAGGLDVTYLESDAGHHIDPQHVPAATQWLANTIGSTQSTPGDPGKA